jgi:hypothetical protein
MRNRRATTDIEMLAAKSLLGERFHAIGRDFISVKEAFVVSHAAEAEYFEDPTKALSTLTLA